MEYVDYYKVLGVDRKIGKEDLKKKYRKLARQYHPDVNVTDKDAADKFGAISEAYEVLGDDEKRRKYDSVAADWERHGNPERPDQFDWSRYAASEGGTEQRTTQTWDDLFGGASGASDFFRSLFGERPGTGERSRFATRGPDYHAELSLSLEEAFAGGARVLAIGQKQIRLTLKPGVWDRQTIKISGKGASGSNGAGNGDLYLTFHLQPHAEYRLEGTHLFHDIPVSVCAALLGTTLEVKTISGTYKVRIPPETRNGTVFKLRGRGFPVYRKPGHHGDLFLKVALQLPENLTSQERTLVRQLAALRGEPVGGDQK